jgi:hypothetical protein
MAYHGYHTTNPEKPSVFLPHGGYRKLRSCKVAEAVYDATVVFCRRFYPQNRCMVNQPFWGCSGYPDCRGTLSAGASCQPAA